MSKLQVLVIEKTEQVLPNNKVMYTTKSYITVPDGSKDPAQTVGAGSVISVMTDNSNVAKYFALGKRYEVGEIVKVENEKAKENTDKDTEEKK